MLSQLSHNVLAISQFHTPAKNAHYTAKGLGTTVLGLFDTDALGGILFF